MNMLKRTTRSLLLLLGILGAVGCAPEGPHVSGATNWLRCAVSTDCQGAVAASCSSDGFCLDSEGERIEVSRSVVLRAIVGEGGSDDSSSIIAEWTNGTDDPVFLRGCTTVDGEYLDSGAWINHGAFAQCAVETMAIEVAPGATYLDPALPLPDRGDTVWRLIGSYGIGCSPGELLSEAGCAQLLKLTSNEVTP